MADELKATPVKREWALKLADALRSGREYANKLELPFFGGAGDFVLGKTPEGLERVAYDEPLTSGSGWTTRLRPETVDMGFTALDVLPVGKVLAKGLRKGTEAASTAAVRGITGNPNATPIGVIDEIQRMNLLPSATVWHGSPHSFDKFDLSKMGTGEGNQAFGPGLYLAESPGVAKSYQFIDATIEPSQVKYGGKKLETLYNNAQRAQDMAHRMPNGPAKNAAIDQANAELGFWEDLMTRNHPKQVIENINAPDYGWDTQAKFVNSLDLNKFSGVDMNPGNLYKVDLPDEKIAQMIDWDIPLSEQSQAIQDFARNADISGTTDKTKKIIEAWREGRDVGLPAKGEHLINAVTNWGDKGLDATRQMLEQGIPGVKYLDAMSRDAAEGTRNYVVFSDEIPQILERNGQPIAQALRDYRGSHTAPGPEFGAPLHDLTGGGQMYPEDVYSRNAVQYYGTGDTKLDKESFALAQRMRNKPEEMIDIYRAVPNEGDITSINAGDWVTINPNYAKQHGESNLPEGYKILQQKVPAKSVWTNADSIHEYGYWPE